MKIISVLKAIVSVLFLTELMISQGMGQIIFSDNFDSHSNWSPTQKTGGQVNAASSSDSQELPSGGGYDYYCIDGSSYSDKGENTLNIDSHVFMGTSGKAFIFYSEKQNTNGWGNDGLLGIQLPGGETGYNEIFIRFYVKFQAGWRWQSNADIGQKMLHVAHHKSSDSKQAFFSITENKPRAFFKIYKVQNGIQGSDVLGEPTVSKFNGLSNPNYPEGAIYFPGGSYGGDGIDYNSDRDTYRAALSQKYGSSADLVDPIFTAIGNPQFQAANFPAGMFGDGDWHCWEFQLKMNSAAGATDGVFSFWQDGIKIYSFNDIDWIESGGGNPKDRQWNYVWLGGNNNNVYSSASEESEQWYAIDNLVISTTPIGVGDLPKMACPEDVNIVH